MSICLSTESRRKSDEWDTVNPRMSYRISNHRSDYPSFWASRKSYRPASTSWVVCSFHLRFRLRILPNLQDSNTKMRKGRRERSSDVNFSRVILIGSSWMEFLEQLYTRHLRFFQKLTKRFSLFFDVLQYFLNSVSIFLGSFLAASSSLALNFSMTLMQTSHSPSLRAAVKPARATTKTAK